MDKKWIVYTLLVLAGVVFSDKIRALPLGSKIPTI
jgi:hypothetical protein